MADSLPYNLVDFKAVMKHCFFSGQDDEALYCEDTDKRVNTWQYSAQRFLERYQDLLFGDDTTPRHLIVAHDMGHEYRSAVFEGYKQKRREREKSEVELEQLDKLYSWAKSFFTALGATQIGVEGVEADDVLAWLCQGLQGPKQVFTVDADLLQLVNEQTLVYLKAEAHGPEGEFHGIPYHLTSIAKSMIGDTSDCYKGVPQIGPSKFEALLEAYGEDGIEQLRDVIDSNNPELLDQAIEATGDKTLIRLRDHWSDWSQAWKLAKLHPELCWRPRGKKLVKPIIHKRVPSPVKLYTLLAQAGAEDLWGEVFEPMTPRQFAITAENWDDMRSAIFDEIAAGDITAFDYETHDHDPNPNFLEASTGDGFVDMLSHRLTGAAFTFGKHLENTVYVSVDHKDSPNLPATVIAEILEHAGRHTQLVVQNALFEGVISQTNLNLQLRNVHDTRIMQRYVDENGEAGLKAMSKHYLNYDQASYQDTVGDKGGMADLTLDEVFGYGVDDGIVTGALYDLLKVLLMADQQWDFYCRWAVRPTEVLQHSYIHGVDVNWKLQREVHQDDLHTLETCMKELREILSENVTGDPTEGFKSFVEAEREYMSKAWRRKLREKAGDDADEDEIRRQAKAKVEEWVQKYRDACHYQPYTEEEKMPRFSPTPKQLSKAAEALALPEIEKTSMSFLTDYLADQGMLGFGGEHDLTQEQEAFLVALLDAFEAGVFKSGAKGDKVEEAKQKLGDVAQHASGVEPKLVKSGDELSLGSSQQMQQLIYCKIGVPVRLFGTTLGKGRIQLGVKQAAPATDEKAIQTAIANDVEEGSWQERALKLLLRAKSSLTKIQLYHNKYPLWKHHKDGKVHPSFTDAGTDTRRPTGSSPNMLQVSKKDKVMRQMFMPPSKDHVVVAIDYASQEIRLMACEAQDPTMMSVYDPANEKDLHSMTGAGIANMPYSEFIEAREDENHKLNPLVEAVRKKAKGVNFGLAYGAGPGTLSRNLIVPVEEARQLLDNTFELYDRIRPWQEETARFMDKHGYTLTAFGTKRHATSDLFSKDEGKRARQHRQGTNATIQGTAAEMLRIVLTKIAERELTERLNMVFFAPIYDEVVAFVHKDDVVEYCREMRDIMSAATPPGHEIPQVPEFSIGATWGSVHELGRWPGESAIEAATQRALDEGEEIWDNEMEEAA